MSDATLILGAFSRESPLQNGGFISQKEDCGFNHFGIVGFAGERLSVHREVFEPANKIDLPYDLQNMAGMNSFLCVASRIEDKSMKAVDIQPLVFNSQFGQIAIAFEGEIERGEHIREELVESGVVFHTGLGSEIAANFLIGSKKATVKSALNFTLQSVSGQYSCVVITPLEMIAATRSSLKRYCLFAGLCGNTWLISNEIKRLQILQAEQIRRISSGEIFEGGRPE